MKDIYLKIFMIFCKCNRDGKCLKWNIFINIYNYSGMKCENKFKFYYRKMTTSVGNIAVECSDTLEV